MTNGDRIRMKKDEELAMLLQPTCPPYEKCHGTEPHDCYKCWLNWLGKEAEELLAREGVWYIGLDGLLHCSSCDEIPINEIIYFGQIVYDLRPIVEKMKYCPICGACMGDVNKLFYKKKEE